MSRSGRDFRESDKFGKFQKKQNLRREKHLNRFDGSRDNRQDRRGKGNRNRFAA